MTSPPVRLGVVRDYRAENWPSMDLCADQFLAHLPAAAPGVDASEVAPPFRRAFGRLPTVGRSRAAFNADRVINRHVLLPRAVRAAARRFDLIHVVDHSYAMLANAVPAGRAGVYCHDLDAFRCLLDPAADPRPWWFRRLAARALAGLRAAAVVFHNTRAVGDEILRHRLVDPGRLVHAPLGVAAEFAPGPPAHAGPPYLLHVGSAAPRKRLDVALDIYSVSRQAVPGLRLVQVGGEWPPAVAAAIRERGLEAGVTQVRGISRDELAGWYRGAAAVLMPSDAEGFGLPVAEALACGAAVVASDLPALREAGGGAAVYCPPGDVPAWAAAVARVLTDPGFAPPRHARLAHAAKFSWAEHSRVIGEAYLKLAGGG